jgi:hypothetical protein
MKVGDLVKSIGFGENKLFVVLETRISPSMTIGRVHFRSGTEIRLYCAENPFFKETFCNTEHFELISEAK